MSLPNINPHAQQTDISNLSLPQLIQLKHRLDQELSIFQESLQSLKVAQAKLLNSGEHLEKLMPEANGKDALVPLPDSMYMPDKLADPNLVLVDIGTGHHVETEAAGAKEYLKSRLAFVTQQMEKIQAIGLEKSKIRDAVVEIIDLKQNAALT